MTLLRSYSSGLDDLRPTLQLALDEGVELLRGATNDLGGLRSCDGRANRRHLQNLVEDAVDARDERGIHAGRPGDAVPNGNVVARYRLPGRRRVRQLRHRPPSTNQLTIGTLSYQAMSRPHDPQREGGRTTDS